MPYIKQERRYQLNDEDIQIDGPRNAGELNFMITMLCRYYFERNGGRYQQINDVLGALEGCKLEFYRRIAYPYEDKKRAENGDVY